MGLNKNKFQTISFFSAFAFTSIYVAATATAESTVASSYQLQRLVAPSPFCGVHGLAIDQNDNLYAGSVVGQRVYKVDKINGAAEVLVGPPKGNADDMEFLPDGTLVWTSISQDAVRAMNPEGEIRDLATNLNSVNSLAYRESDGRLFVAQVFGGDGLWEIDVNGAKPPRNIINDMGGLNGFDIGPDGMIYGPLWFKHQVVKINPDNGELRVIADGFHTPAAANFDSQWNLYVLDTGTGEIIKVDIATGAKSVFAQLETSLDNLAIDSNDTLYVSNMADNSIQAIDIETKAIRSVVEAGLSCPSSLAVAAGQESDEVYIADVFALRRIDGQSGEKIDIARSHAADTPIAYASSVFAGKDHFYVVSSGQLQQYLRSSDKFLRTFDHIRGAQFVAELDNGDLLVISRRGNRLTRYGGADKQEQQVITDDLGGATSLAVLDNTRAIVALANKNALASINLHNGAIELLSFTFNRPIDIKILNNSQWLVRESHGRVTRLNPNNSDRLIVVDNFPSGRLNPDQGNRSNAMGIGANGAIYLLSDIDNSIYKLTSK